MTAPEEAAENLRVIRNLMERATVYRAISAPTALCAGILAIPAAALTAHRGLAPMAFFGLWMGIYLAIDLFNACLLWQDAKRRGADFVTSSLLHAVASLGPPMLVGAVVSLLVIRDSVLAATVSWLLFYGLGLLATHSFSPTSIKVLGAAFVCAGLGIACAWRFGQLEDSAATASWVMGATFGALHLIYGVVIGLRTGFRVCQATEPTAA